MIERILTLGNEAVGRGALGADCQAFFGYPISPQNEITEWFAREFPKRGKVFVQTSSEGAAISWLYGAAAAGVRAMTSTSSPGWGLMQEGMSHLANAELPCVIVLVQRGGPGSGTTRHSQMDYLSATRGGGHGGYKNIVLAPASVQEIHELVQLAFYLADKYRNPVVVLMDGIIGQMMEILEIKRLEFGSLPEKDWAVLGKSHHKDGRPHICLTGQGFFPTPEYPSYLFFLGALNQKNQQMSGCEVRYETYRVEDAESVLIAFGYVARACREALCRARDRGLKVGLIRPITLWPFPYQVIKEKAVQGVKFLVVEDNLGQMIEDVRMAVEGQAEVHFMGALERHDPGEGGAIFPLKVLEKIEKLLGGVTV